MDTEPPKIGLVLSGGGAKGMAHVGVIRAMEKAGIRPDYVVGTSMGSVVGGLYALGYNADELEEIIRSIDWELIISNRVGFEKIAFEEKEYYNRYLLELPMKEGKISLPSGLIEGQVLSETLHYFTWPASKYATFDDFPIPFRCIATDISTGKAIVFDKGYLHDAIRSSIAIPTAFTAFQLDSTMVVDGGVVNNFPVDVVKAMGADFVIGVNVSDENFLAADKLDGFGAILMQLAMASSLGVTGENIENTDIYIKPDLGPYGTASFGDYDAILKIGDKTGEAFYPKFQKMADSLGISRLSPGIGLEGLPMTFDKIEVSGNGIFPTSLIISKLGIEPGKEVSREDIRDGINRVFGMNGFYKVDYSLVHEVGQHFSLLIRVKEKPKQLLNVAFHYDNQFSAGILLNFTARDFIGKSSRTLFIGDISQNPKFRIDHYKYVGGDKKYAFNFRANYLNQQIPSYVDGEEDNVFVSKNTRMEAQMISTSSLKESFTFGGIFENIKAKYRFGNIVSDDLKNAYQRSLGMRFRYYRNSQNDRNYPTKGAEGLIQTTFNLKQWIGVNLVSGVDSVTLDVDGEQVEVPVSAVENIVEQLTPSGHGVIYGRYSKFLSLGHRFQFKPSVAVGVVFSQEEGDKIFQDFYVGGYQNVRFDDTPFWGLNYAEVQTPNFLKLGADFQFVPIHKIYFRAGMNWMGYSQQYAFNEVDWPDKVFQDDYYFGYGADVSYASILGPITLGISSNSQDHVFRYYLSIGLSFNYSDR
ncbi:patatin-like phospholipase family protein [Algoriphagus jejuensis]|uniref:Patatin-like phospholipase family protein n=1 Tax=Algoriphagus jejuensis TaxID=419934 RepID=A0ABN1N418_9BACT